MYNLFDLIQVSDNGIFNIFFVLMACWSIGAVHEMGHYFAMKICGLNVKEVVIGLPPINKTGKFRFGLVPGGVTVPENYDPIENDKNVNIKIMFISAAGMLAQVMVNVILLMFASNNVVTAYMFLNTVMGSLNLLPIKEGKRPTDGLKIYVVAYYTFIKHNKNILAEA